MELLQVSNVSKRFGGLIAIRDCSFAIEKGRTTCLIGPNGAGKTTLFNLITGFLKPDTGSITYKGQPLVGRPARSIVGLGIARSFQHLALFKELTVLENVMVALPGQPDEGPGGALLAVVVPAIGKARRRARDKAMGLLSLVGLADRAGTVVGNLSYGEQKLLAIARVLATDAQILLLDEPASGLDDHALDNIVEVLAGIKANDRTLLVIEHNTSLVRKIADDVVFLHQGHVLAKGDPDTIMKTPELTEIYFGGGVVHA